MIQGMKTMDIIDQGKAAMGDKLKRCKMIYQSSKGRLTVLGVNEEVVVVVAVSGFSFFSLYPSAILLRMVIGLLFFF
jgi:hypothetical protein